MKKLYSNSGLIMLAILTAGIWFSNVLSFFPTESAPEDADFDAAPISPLSPTPSAIKLYKRQPRETIEEALRRPVIFTAQCKDGTLSYSRERHGTCSYHGGVAQWFSHE